MKRQGHREKGVGWGESFRRQSLRPDPIFLIIKRWLLPWAGDPLPLPVPGHSAVLCCSSYSTGSVQCFIFRLPTQGWFRARCGYYKFRRHCTLAAMSQSPFSQFNKICHTNTKPSFIVFPCSCNNLSSSLLLITGGGDAAAHWKVSFQGGRQYLCSHLALVLTDL